MSKRSLLLLTLVLSSCASTPKFDLNEEIKKESEILKINEGKSEDGYLSLKAESSQNIEVSYQEDKGVPLYIAKINVGTSIECIIYKQLVPNATAIVTLQKNVLAKASSKEISFIDSGSVKSLPFLRLDTTYLVDNGGNKLGGDLKIAVASKGPNTIACLSQELGYKKTFQRIFEQVLTSFSSKGTEAALKQKYQEIQKFTLKDQSIGFSSTEIYKGEEDANVVITFSSMLIRQSAFDVVAADDIVTEISDKKGNLVRRISMASAGDAVTHEIELKSIDGKIYRVEGKVQGKDVSSEIKTNSGIVSGYQGGKLLREKILSGKEKSLTLIGYNPQLSPLKLISSNVKLKSSTKNNVTTTVETSGMVLTVDYNKDGSVKEMIIPAGPLKIKATGIFKAGSY